MPDKKNLGVSDEDKEKIDAAYETLANAIGADIIGKYISDISIA